MKYLLVLSLIIAITVAKIPIDIPLPKHPDGYRYPASTPNAPIRLDIFEDLLCSDCKKFDPPFKQWLKTTTVEGKPITDFVEVVYHIFPLPYHYNSMFTAQLVSFLTFY